MTPFEIETAMKSMQVLVDTREQPTQKFRRRTESFGYPWRRETLSAGDYGCEYTAPDGSVVRTDSRFAIERKMNIDELAMCFGKERKRFIAEFERAKAAGTRMHIVIENGSWDDVRNGNYRSKMAPKSLWASLLTLAVRYDVHTHFCTPDSTGWLIGNILHYELRELLEGENEQTD